MSVTTADGEIVLDAVDITRIYNGGKANEVQALRGASMGVRRGEMVAVMGPSGSGKSTLMHVLGCLDRPTSGVVRLAGREVSNAGEKERTAIRARDLGFVFQGYNLIPTLTAFENVAIARDYAGFPRKEQAEPAREALRAVGLGMRLDHKPSQLSGGEQQRVALARALVNQPAILLADEPTGNLDSEKSTEVMDLLRQLNDERGQTMVIVTHDDEVGRRCDRTIRMRDGHIV